MLPQTMYPVPNTDLYNTRPAHLSCSLGTSSMWSIGISMSLGHPNLLRSVETVGKVFLAFEMSKLIASPVIYKLFRGSTRLLMNLFSLAMLYIVFLTFFLLPQLTWISEWKWGGLWIQLPWHTGLWLIPGLPYLIKRCKVSHWYQGFSESYISCTFTLLGRWLESPVAYTLWPFFCCSLMLGEIFWFGFMTPVHGLGFYPSTDLVFLLGWVPHTAESLRGSIDLAHYQP